MPTPEMYSLLPGCGHGLKEPFSSMSLRWNNAHGKVQFGISIEWKILQARYIEWRFFFFCVPYLAKGEENVANHVSNHQKPDRPVEVCVALHVRSGYLLFLRTKTCGHTWHWMSLLRPGVIKQTQTNQPIIYGSISLQTIWIKFVINLGRFDLGHFDSGTFWLGTFWLGMFWLWDVLTFDVLTLGRFDLGRFDSGTFWLGMLWLWDVLTWDVLTWDVLTMGRFDIGTFWHWDILTGNLLEGTKQKPAARHMDILTPYPQRWRCIL